MKKVEKLPNINDKLKSVKITSNKIGDVDSVLKDYFKENYEMEINKDIQLEESFNKDVLSLPYMQWYSDKNGNIYDVYIISDEHIDTWLEEYKWGEPIHVHVYDNGNLRLFTYCCYDEIVIVPSDDSKPYIVRNDSHPKEFYKDKYHADYVDKRIGISWDDYCSIRNGDKTEFYLLDEETPL